MIEHDFENWDRLLFRDYLIAHPEVAHQYQELKIQLATVYSKDREGYTRAKTEFIVRITERAKDLQGDEHKPRSR